MSGYADKIRRLRIAAGKSEQEMAAAIRINLPSYYDLESYDDEVIECLSLSELTKMCQILGITVIGLLSDDSTDIHKIDHLSFTGFAEAVRQYIESRGLTVEEFENTIGWEVRQLLSDPEVMWELNVQFIKDACSELGISWLRVVPQ